MIGAKIYVLLKQDAAGKGEDRVVNRRSLERVEKRDGIGGVFDCIARLQRQHKEPHTRMVLSTCGSDAGERA